MELIRIDRGGGTSELGAVIRLMRMSVGRKDTRVFDR